MFDRLRTVSDAYSRGELGLAEARAKLKDYLINEHIPEPGAANLEAVLDALDRAAEKDPLLRKQLRFLSVGTVVKDKDGLAGLISPGSGDRLMGENDLFFATKIGGKPGILMNPQFLSMKPKDLKEQLAYAVEMKLHPPGCDTLKSQIDHEAAHLLDGLLGPAEHEEIRRIYADLQARNAFRKELSEYAENSEEETISELWSEYRNNPKPRALCRKIGPQLEKCFSRAKIKGDFIMCAIIPPLCYFCRHYHTEAKGSCCDAFEKELPRKFEFEGYKHFDPEPGDHGIRFEVNPNLNTVGQKIYDYRYAEEVKKELAARGLTPPDTK